MYEKNTVKKNNLFSNFFKCSLFNKLYIYIYKYLEYIQKVYIYINVLYIIYTFCI